jgi:hypothetical protein
MLGLAILTPTLYPYIKIINFLEASLVSRLSPNKPIVFLKPLDDVMQRADCFYVRFMDDWIMISLSKWKLRRAVKLVNTILAGLLLAKQSRQDFYR